LVTFFLRVPHQGIIAPPKLEHTFSLGLEFGEMIHMSPPLQLARLDFGSGFYMPRISGLIPNSGNMQTVIQCGKNVAFLSIASVIVEEMRVINVRAKYIMCNRTSLSLQVLSECRCIVICLLKSKLFHNVRKLRNFLQVKYFYPSIDFPKLKD
jgi:hypothetical protein